MQRVSLFFTFLVAIESPALTTTGEKGIPTRKKTDCSVCKTFAESFVKGIERTTKSTFDGGDTAWEEEKLGDYATSELRLAEIQEKLCLELTESKELCYLLYEENESEIEKWWFDLQQQHPDFEKYFCLDKLKSCCPKDHFAPPICQACPGYPNNVCSNNGYCKENGKCACNQGYIGKNCEDCSTNYFESYRNDTTFTCLPCPISCKDSCSKSGCTKCKDGWIMDHRNQCLDIDECSSNPESICSQSEFCSNTEGGYQCLPCHISCEGCFGSGSEMCEWCSEGYKMIGDSCSEEIKMDERNFLSMVKLFLYLGVWSFTCVVYINNDIMAVFVALICTFYVAVVENTLNTMFNYIAIPT